MRKRFVGYVRVSTSKQGRSGLGMEAQLDSILRHVQYNQGLLLGEYSEVESRTKCDRPALADALKHCRMAGAVLVIARLDRLAGNVHFVSGLMESKVEFVACDNPTANRFTLHILAAVNEKEVADGRIRTTAGLKALKDRGVPLGVNAMSVKTGQRIGNLIPLATSLKNLEAARAARTAQKQEAYKDYLPLLLQLRSSGKTLRLIAADLNGLGYLTRSGKPWNHVQVGRVLSLETSP